MIVSFDTSLYSPPLSLVHGLAYALRRASEANTISVSKPSHYKQSKRNGNKQRLSWMVTIDPRLFPKAERTKCALSSGTVLNALAILGAVPLWDSLLALG